MGIDSSSTGEESAAKYIVPYMIYSNYDLTPHDGGNGHVTSLNYLGSRLLDIVGLEKTAYLKFVQEVEKQAPAICTIGWWDSDMTFHNSSDLLKIDSAFKGTYIPVTENRYDKDALLTLYYWTEYNLLKDSKNKLVDYYVLNYDAYIGSKASR